MFAAKGMRSFAAAVAALGSAAALAAPPPQPGALLPDIQASHPTDIEIVTSFVIGETLRIRFTTLSRNEGAGPVELVGGETNSGNGTQKVYQRIYLEQGGSYDQLAGNYEWHEAHQHIHFGDYADYILQPVNAPGGSQREGQKTSFCLMDSERTNSTLPGAPNNAVYTTCDAVTQGISVGWGDEYGYWLADQDIQVTGLPNGIYRLMLDIDPKNKLTESNEDNNTASVLLDLDFDNRTVTQIEDDWDADGLVDSQDNCIEYANGPNIPDAGGNMQLDGDGDGYGNGCDADLNNDNFVNSLDLGLFKAVYLSNDNVADLNGDGIVNSLDIGRFKQLFLQPPGPSGTAP